MSSTVHPANPPERRRLDAWKGVAQYLGRDVTTVRRWEKREGLPVHRHLHEKLGSVYAFTDEIDEWWRQRLVRLATAEAIDAISDNAGPEVTVEQATAVHPAVHPAAIRRPLRRAWWIGLGALLLVGMTAQLTNGPWPSRARARNRSEFRAALAAPAHTVVDSLVISPDGRQMAFAAHDAGGVRLWVQQVASQEASPVPGTDDAAFPFWSADSEHVGFFAGGRLKCVTLLTQKVRDLAPAPKGQGGDWNERGDIVFAPDAGSALMRVSSSGGAVTAATALGGKSFKEGHAWPQFLPGGRRFLYLDNTISGQRHGIYVGDLDTGAVKRVLPAYSSARYADGFLIFSVPSKRALMAQSFDLDRLEVVGEPFLVAERPLHRSELSQFVDFSVSNTGTLVVRSAEDERNKLVWIDRRSGQVTGTVGTPGYYSNPTLSPDEHTLAATVTEDNTGHLWFFDTGTGKATPVTTGIMDWAPLWSPGGDRLLFLSSRAKDSGVYDRNLANGEETRVFPEKSGQIPESRSRDGRYLTFGNVAVQTKWDVWAWTLDEPRRAFPVVTNPGNDGQSQLSPDGRFIAYASDESGRFEIYVRSFPTSTETWRVSAAGGADPRWRHDGREIYFLAPDGKMMAASVGSGARFRNGAPRSMFDTGITVFWADTRNHYDVTRDGQKFIVLVPDADRRYGPYTAIVNWQR